MSSAGLVARCRELGLVHRIVRGTVTGLVGSSRMRLVIALLGGLLVESAARDRRRKPTAALKSTATATSEYAERDKQE